MKPKPRVRFKKWDCVVEYSTYIDNNRVAIILRDADDGSPVAVASINLPMHPIGSNQVAIKNYSENEGLLDVLINAGIVSEPTHVVHSGYVDIPVCDFLGDRS